MEWLEQIQCSVTKIQKITEEKKFNQNIIEKFSKEEFVSNEGNLEKYGAWLSQKF